MPRDIRDLRDDPDAYAAELRRRWGGLLSYRYIGRTHAALDAGPADNTVTLRLDMRDAAGGILLGVLGIAAPEGGAMSDLDAVPNPVVHSCQVLDAGRDVAPIEVITEVVKRGKTMSFSRSRIVDADNPARVLALTAGQGVSIGTPPGALERIDTEPLAIVDGPDLPPLWRVFGGQRRDDGEWSLPKLDDDVASPDGALHIGPQFVMLEHAATTAMGAPTRSSHVMFVARGKVGPFRIEADEYGRAQLFDEGNGDRLVSTASYTFA